MALNEIKRMRSRKKYLAEVNDRYAVIKEEDEETAVKPIPPTDKSVGILGVIL